MIQTEQDKESIAKLLGWKLCDCGEGKAHYKFGPLNWQVYGVDDLNFDFNWNMLMEAINKIESLGYDTGICGIVINGEKLTEVLISPQVKKDGVVEFHLRDSKSKIELTYEIVVLFANWYNLNKQ